MVLTYFKFYLLGLKIQEDRGALIEVLFTHILLLIFKNISTSWFKYLKIYQHHGL